MKLKFKLKLNIISYKIQIIFKKIINSILFIKVTHIFKTYVFYPLINICHIMFKYIRNILIFIINKLLFVLYWIFGKKIMDAVLKIISVLLNYKKRLNERFINLRLYIGLLTLSYFIYKVSIVIVANKHYNILFCKLWVNDIYVQVALLILCIIATMFYLNYLYRILAVLGAGMYVKYIRYNLNNPEEFNLFYFKKQVILNDLPRNIKTETVVPVKDIIDNVLIKATEPAWYSFIFEYDWKVITVVTLTTIAAVVAIIYIVKNFIDNNSSNDAEISQLKETIAVLSSELDQLHKSVNSNADVVIEFFVEHKKEVNKALLEHKKEVNKTLAEHTTNIDTVLDKANKLLLSDSQVDNSKLITTAENATVLESNLLNYEMKQKEIDISVNNKIEDVENSIKSIDQSIGFQQNNIRNVNNKIEDVENSIKSLRNQQNSIQSWMDKQSKIIQGLELSIEDKIQYLELSIEEKGSLLNDVIDQINSKDSITSTSQITSNSTNISSNFSNFPNNQNNSTNISSNFSNFPNNQSNSTNISSNFSNFPNNQNNSTNISSNFSNFPNNQNNSTNISSNFPNNFSTITNYPKPTSDNDSDNYKYKYNYNYNSEEEENVRKAIELSQKEK